MTILLLSCKGADDDSSRLNSYFKNKQYYNLSEDTKAIFVLSEEGCLSCNRMFSDIVLEYVHKKDIVCLVNASGTKIDLTPFEDIKGQIFFDADNKDTLFVSSKVIFLNNKNIDTIININSATIKEDFDFIKSKIK